MQQENSEPSYALIVVWRVLSSIVLTIGLFGFLFSHRLITDYETATGAAGRLATTISSELSQMMDVLTTVRLASLLMILFGGGLLAILLLKHGDSDTLQRRMKVLDSETFSYIIGLFGLVGGIGYYLYWAAKLPNVSTIIGKTQAASMTIQGNFADAYIMPMIQSTVGLALAIAAGLSLPATYYVFSSTGTSTQRGNPGSRSSSSNENYCVECGAELPSRGVFCPECGAER